MHRSRDNTEAGKGGLATNTIVNKLLEVDREARRMIEEARQYQERTLQDIQREKQRMVEDFEEKARRHIRELEEEQAGEVQEAVAGINGDTQRVRAAMKQHYETNHAGWEDALYRMVTGD